MSKSFSRAALTLLVLAAGVPAAHAVGTAAGTDITNVARATCDGPDGPKEELSNPAVLRVDELLDVTIVVNDAGNVSVTTPEADRHLSFTVTNTGNGPEQYALDVNSALGGDQFDPANVRVYFDDGDGIFEPLQDTLYVPSGVPTVAGNEPVLAADQSMTVFVVSDIPGALNNGDVGLASLYAEALTAQATDIVDAPGYTFTGAGANGADAVVGATQADAVAQNGYLVSQILTSFAKTQSVSDPFGGNAAVPGAIITYTLTFTGTGSGTLDNLLLVDEIPANTTYQPGTITLNSAPVTDIVDGDSAVFNATYSANGRIEVNLGDGVTVPVTHVVSFQVKID